MNDGAAGDYCPQCETTVQAEDLCAGAGVDARCPKCGTLFLCTGETYTPADLWGQAERYIGIYYHADTYCGY